MPIDLFPEADDTPVSGRAAAPAKDLFPEADDTDSAPLGVRLSDDGIPDYTLAFMDPVENASSLGKIGLRAMVGRVPDLIANTVELPANANEALARTLGIDVESPGVFDTMRGVLRSGAEFIRGVGYSQEMADVGYGNPSVSGSQLVEALNPSANSNRAQEAEAFGEPGNYQPITMLDRAKVVGAFIPETLIGSAPDMVATLNPLTLGGYISSRTNEIAKDRAANDKRAEVGLGDLVAGGVAAPIEALLERFTTMRLLPHGTTLATPGVLPAMGRIAKELGLQGSLGGIEELVPYLASSAGTETGASGQQALETFVEGAISEGGLGGAVQGAKEAIGSIRSAVASPNEAPDLFPEADEAPATATATGAPMAPDVAPTTAIPIAPITEDNTRFMRPPPETVEAPAATESPLAPPSALPAESVAEAVPVPVADAPVDIDTLTEPVVAEDAKTRAARLFSDYTPETVNALRQDGDLKFVENRLTRRALDEEMASPNRSVRGLLETIAEQPDLDEAERWLAQKLAPLSEKLGIGLVEPSQKYKHGGAYDTVDNNIWIRQAKPDIVLHEALHGPTSALMKNKAVANSDPTLRRVNYEFDTMLSHLQSEIGFGNIDISAATEAVRNALNDKQGPLSNTRELLTYGMTDKPFRNWLKTLPPPPGRTDVRNMWEAFKKAVMLILGDITPAQRSFLDALIESTGELVDFAEANPELVRSALPESARKPSAAPPAKPPATSAPKPAVPPTSAKNTVMQREQDDSQKSSPTSIKNSEIDRERAATGASPLKSVYKSDDDLLAEGRSEIEKNKSAPNELIDRIMSAPGSPISDRDTAVMQVHWNDLSKQLDRAADRAVDESLSDEDRSNAVRRFDELSQQAFTAQEAYRIAGTTTARALAFRRRMLTDQFTLERMERGFSVISGKKLSLSEKADIKAHYEDIAKKQAKLDETQKKLDDQLVGDGVQATYQQLLKDMAAAIGKKPSIAALKSRADESRKALKAMAPGAAVTSDTLDPAALTGAEFIHLANIGAYHVAKGANTQVSFDKAMREDVGNAYDDALPEVFEAAKMQAEAANPTPEQALSAVDPQKLTHRDVYDMALAHVRKGVKGEDAVMKAVFNDLKETVPDLTERKVRQLFSEYGKAKFPSKDADKRELREIRALVQLQESIDRAEAGLKPLKSGLQRDKATAAIMEKRARLNELLRQQEVKAAPSPEKVAGYQQARALNLKKQIEALDRMLFTGERNGKRVNMPQNAETARLEALRDTLRSEMKTVDRDMDAGRRELAAAKKRDESALKRLQGEIDRIEAGLPKEAKGPAKPRSTAVQKKFDELETLRAKHRKMRSEQMAAQREAERPEYSPERAFQKMRATSIARQLEEIKARIAANDYERRAVRAPKTLNEANQQAAFELAKAKEAFLKYQFEKEMSRRTPIEKLVGIAKDAAAMPQPLMTSLDLSALLRQGFLIAASRPMIAIKTLPTMFRSFRSAEKAHAAEEKIKNSKNYPLMKRAGLEITTDNPLAKLSDMEEKFRSRWIEKFDLKEGETAKNAVRTGKNIATAHVRASNRAFVATLNTMRSAAFDALLKTWTRDPANPTTEELKAIARWINIATGRGEIPFSGGRAPGFLGNVTIFAPRLLASRFNMLYGLPYFGGTRKTKMMVAAEYARIWAGAAVILSLGALLNQFGDDDDDERPFIETDTRSTNFGKMRFGKVYVDPFAGFAQTTTFLSRLASGEKVTQSGEIVPLRAEYRPMNLLRDKPIFDKPKFGMGDAAGEFGRFFRTKMAPIPGAAINLASGSDVIGNKVTPTSTAISLVTPLSAADIVEIMQSEGIPKATAMAVAAVFGMGVQNRDPSQLAEDYTDMTTAERKVYGDYEIASKALKAKQDTLQAFANQLPKDMLAADMKLAVSDKAKEMGFEGSVSVDTYKTNTTSRDPDTGKRMRGAKRNEKGGVRLNTTEAWDLVQLRATEKKVGEIEKRIEKINSEPVTKFELRKMPTSYYSGELTSGDAQELATDAEKENALKILREERKYQQELFLRNTGAMK